MSSRAFRFAFVSILLNANSWLPAAESHSSPAAVAAFLADQPVPRAAGPGAVRVGLAASSQFPWVAVGQGWERLDDPNFTAWRRKGEPVGAMRMPEDAFAIEKVSVKKVAGTVRHGTGELLALWTTITPGVLRVAPSRDLWRIAPSVTPATPIPASPDDVLTVWNDAVEDKIVAAREAGEWDRARELARPLRDINEVACIRLRASIIEGFVTETARRMLCTEPRKPAADCLRHLAACADADGFTADDYLKFARRNLREIIAPLDPRAVRVAKLANHPGFTSINHEMLIEACLAFSAPFAPTSTAAQVATALDEISDAELMKLTGSGGKEPFVFAALHLARQADTSGITPLERFRKLSQLLDLSPGLAAFTGSDPGVRKARETLYLLIGDAAERAGFPATAAGFLLLAHQQTVGSAGNLISVEAALGSTETSPLARSRRLVAGIAVHCWPALDASEPATSRLVDLLRGANASILQPATLILGVVPGPPESFLRAVRRVAPEAEPLVLSGSGPDLVPKKSAKKIFWKETFNAIEEADPEDPAAVEMDRIKSLRKRIREKQSSIGFTEAFDQTETLQAALAERAALQGARQETASQLNKGQSVLSQGELALKTQPPTDATGRQLASQLDSALREVRAENIENANRATAIDDRLRQLNSTISEIGPRSQSLRNSRQGYLRELATLQSELAAAEARLPALGVISNRRNRYARRIKNDVESMETVDYFINQQLSTRIAALVAAPKTPERDAEASWQVWWFGRTHRETKPLPPALVPLKYPARGLAAESFALQIEYALALADPRKAVVAAITDTAAVLAHNESRYAETMGPALREFILATSTGPLQGTALRDLANIKLTVRSPDADAVFAALPEKLKPALRPLLQDVFKGPSPPAK